MRSGYITHPTICFLILCTLMALPVVSLADEPIWSSSQARSTIQSCKINGISWVSCIKKFGQFQQREKTSTPKTSEKTEISNKGKTPFPCPFGERRFTTGSKKICVLLS